MVSKATLRRKLSVDYTIDDPRDTHVAAGGRLKNSAWYIANKWSVGTHVELGLNYLAWRTDWLGFARGTDNRFNLYVTHKF